MSSSCRTRLQFYPHVELTPKWSTVLNVETFKSINICNVVNLHISQNLWSSFHINSMIRAKPQGSVRIYCQHLSSSYGSIRLSYLNSCNKNSSVLWWRPTGDCWGYLKLLASADSKASIQFVLFGNVTT